MVNLYIMSQREKDIMKILWEADTSLTASEICAKNESLSINTVQAVLKKLLKKDYIQIADIVYSGTVLTRSYVAKISSDEYATIQVRELYQFTGKKGVVSNLVSHLLDGEDNEEETIQKLEEMLEERKKNHNKKGR